MKNYVIAEQPPKRGLGLKAVRSVIVIIGVGTGIAFILVSPLLLRYAVGGVDWTRLSEISATYAAVSAIMSGLGVGAVAVALLIQSGQAKAERIDAVRAIHRELITTTLSDMETYAPCWGPFGASTAASRRFFTVQILNYYWQGYDLGVFTESELRSELLPQLFAGKVGRDVWSAVRPAWKADTGSKGRKFFPIVEEEFTRARDLAPPVSANVNNEKKAKSFPLGHDGLSHAMRVGAIGFAGGFICAVAVRRSQRRTTE